MLYTEQQHQAAEQIAATTGYSKGKILSYFASISPIDEQTSKVKEEITFEHLKHWIEQHTCTLEQLVAEWVARLSEESPAYIIGEKQ